MKEHKTLKLSTRPNRKRDNEFCPCGKSNDNNKFCSYIGFEGQGKGFCHSCNKTFFPDKDDNIQYIAPAQTNEAKDKPKPDMIKKLSDYTSNLHSFMQNFAGEDLSEHFEKYLIGTQGSQTLFGYANSTGEILNIKFFQYQSNGKRNKDINPYYTKNCERCLYGLHLYDRAKPAIIVESEKTAQALGLYFDSQYNFLATGGANGAKKEHFLPLIGNEVYYFADNDTAGKENKVLNHLRQLHNEAQIQLKIISPFVDKPNGYDIADYLFEYRQDQTAESLRQWIASTPFAPIAKPKASTPKQNLPTADEQALEASTQFDAKPKIQEQTPSEPKEPSENGQETPAEQTNSDTPQITKIENYLSYKYLFRCNVLTNEIEYSPKFKNNFEIVNPNDIWVELLKLNFKVGKNIVEGLLSSKFVPKYNPITQYFENLPIWDEKTDYINKLANFVTFDKPAERARFALQLKKHLVRMIAQVYKKGYYNKQCLVLVGEKQDTGKTTFLSFLCPPELEAYMRQDLPQADIKHKDNRFALAQNFFINIDELKSFKQDQTNALKALFSLETINDRMHHEKNNTRQKRVASFVASTNNTDFLTDETGSVRWLCFGNVTKIDFSYRQKIDINKIWSQALHLFNNGYEYQVTADEKQESEALNRERYSKTSIEEELLLMHYEPDLQKNNDNFKTVSQILIHLDSIANRKLSDTMLGKALTKHNFQKAQLRINGNKYANKGYFVLVN